MKIAYSVWAGGCLEVGKGLGWAANHLVGATPGYWALYGGCPCTLACGPVTPSYCSCTKSFRALMLLVANIIGGVQSGGFGQPNFQMSVESTSYAVDDIEAMSLLCIEYKDYFPTL